LNRGLLDAQGEVLLFVDDDVEPAPTIVSAHRAAHREGAQLVVAGQVLQPGEEQEPLEGPGFAFRSSVPQEVSEVMGGNFSVSKGLALSIGGFDESFVGAAYRFEADFCARARAAGARIVFEPRASLRHLQERTGGVRSWGSHLRTARPHHAVGEYYYLLRHRGRGWVRRFLSRPLRAVSTRHHLRHPWWIPLTLIGELSAMAWATRMVVRPARLLPARRVGK
jgi:GT2 family glycosyltransferase